MQATRMRYGGSYFYGEHSFFEKSICPGFSEGGKTKSYLALSRGTGGLMRRVLLNAALLACVTPAMAQNSNSSGTAANRATAKTNRQVVGSPTQAVKQAPTAVELPAETPVVTIKGVCDPGKESDSQDCKTVITRGQMDQIVERMAPGTPPASQPQFAIKYVRMLAAAKLAEDRKLEDNPVVAAELQKKVGPGRADVLAKAFYQQMEEAAANATDSELRQYYAEHPSEFEEGEVLRLSLPTSEYSRNGMRWDRALLKTEADGLRSRAVAGYDFDQLQVQAYTDLGIPQPPPPTRLTMARRNSIPEVQAQVFDLQAGEVTPVIESYTKLVFLKLVSKHTATFESVLPDIKAAVKQKRLEQELEKASKSVTADFNLQYLGMHAQPALFTLHPDMQSLANAATPDQRRRVSRRPMARNTAPATVPPQTRAHP
ncbi:MAG: hypothetical protein DMG38_24475 [Acidobacteria bacterium]|nr:MAG: hypothetical protein DMG38_24475 [Acidobacteriota bacterium]